MVVNIFNVKINVAIISCKTVFKIIEAVIQNKIDRLKKDLFFLIRQIKL